MYLPMKKLFFDIINLFFYWKKLFYEYFSYIWEKLLKCFVKVLFKVVMLFPNFMNCVVCKNGSTENGKVSLVFERGER